MFLLKMDPCKNFHERRSYDEPYEWPLLTFVMKKIPLTHLLGKLMKLGRVIFTDLVK